MERVAARPVRERAPERGHCTTDQCEQRSERREEGRLGGQVLLRTQHAVDDAVRERLQLLAPRCRYDRRFERPSFRGIGIGWRGVEAGVTDAANSDFQALLRTVKYKNTDTATLDGNRTITFSAVETVGTDNFTSANVVTTVSVASLNDDAPVLAGMRSDAAGGYTKSTDAAKYTETGDTAIVLESTLTVADSDHTNLTSAVVQVAEGYVKGEDKLALVTTAGTAGAGFTAAWDADTGTLAISGNKTLAEYQAALRTVTYDNENNDNPSTTDRKVEWRLYDGANYSALKETDVLVTSLNDAPTLTGDAGSVQFTEGTPVVIDNNLVLADVDSANLNGATVKITNYKAGDQLLFTPTAGISISGTATGVVDTNANPNTLTLTLTGADTVEAYEAALRSIRFNNTSDNPNATTTRTIEWNVTDVSADASTAQSLASAGTSSVTITAVNDAPVLTGGGNTIQFSEGDAAVVLDNGILLSDPEGSAVTSITVNLSGD